MGCLIGSQEFLESRFLLPGRFRYLTRALVLLFLVYPKVYDELTTELLGARPEATGDRQASAALESLVMEAKV